MATDPQNDPGTDDLPIQPTGSGVADLEIARLQDAVTDGEALDDDAPTKTQA